jgi:hypothetical protein
VESHAVNPPSEQTGWLCEEAMNGQDLAEKLSRPRAA